MRANEFLREAEEAAKAAAVKKLGRAFNHLEDLVFFHGTAGTMEALEHLRDIASEAGAKSIRMKWDGCIHEDTVLKTSKGDLTIKEVVNLYDKDHKSVQVYGKHLDSGVNFVMDIFGTSITTGVKDWVELTFENGSTIKLTEDHEVYTINRGWVAAGNLTVDDDIDDMK